MTEPNEYCSVSVLITQHFGSVFPRLFLIGPIIQWSQTAFTTVISLKPVVQAYDRKLLIICFEIYLWNTELDYFWKSRTESKPTSSRKGPPLDSPTLTWACNRPWCTHWLVESNLFQHVGKCPSVSLKHSPWVWRVQIHREAWALIRVLVPTDTARTALSLPARVTVTRREGRKAPPASELLQDPPLSQPHPRAEEPDLRQARWI